MKKTRKQQAAVVMATAIGVTSAISPINALVQNDSTVKAQDVSNAENQNNVTIGNEATVQESNTTMLMPQESSDKEAVNDKEDVSLKTQTHTSLPENTSAVMDSSTTSNDIDIDSTFEDEQLRLYVRQTFDEDKDGKLSQLEITKAAKLSLKSSTLTSLKGLETLTNLQDVTLNLPKLERIDFTMASLKSLDVSHCNHLKYITCSNSKNLNTLILEDTPLLETLYCSYTNIQNLDVSNHPDLTSVFCTDTPSLEQINASNCPKLTTLNCTRSSKVSKLNFENSDHLEIIRFAYTNVSEFNPQQFKNLNTLECFEAPIKYLNLSNLQNLEVVLCGNCTQLTSLQIDNTPSLKILNIDRTMLTGFNVSNRVEPLELYFGFINLAYLDLGSNITDTPTSANPRYSSFNITVNNKRYFDITDVFPGINPDHITIESGAKKEGAKLYDYKPGKDIVYRYDCGNLNGKPFQLRVTLKHDLKKAAKDITIDIQDKEYDGKPITYKESHTGDTNAMVTWKWEIQSADGSYTEINEIPTKAGNYRASVTVAEDDYYNEASKSVTFTISKTNSTLTFDEKASLQKVYDGNPAENPAVLFNGKPVNNTSVNVNGYDCTLVYNWKKGDEVLKEVPKEPGTYTVVAVLYDEKDQFITSTENVNYEITKIQRNLKITNNLSKQYDGLPVVNPIIEPNYNNVSYKYEQLLNNKWTEINEVPSTPGTYQVRATLAEDEHYAKAESPLLGFTIHKGDTTITMPDTNALSHVYDGKPVNITPTIHGSQKNITYQWEQNINNDWVELKEQPLTPGTYRVSVHVDESDYYKAKTSKAVIYTIAKADSNLQISGLLDKQFDDEYVMSPKITIQNGSQKPVTYIWKEKKGDTLTTLSSAPKNAGSYLVYAHVEGDDIYNSTDSNSIDFTISKASGKIEVSVLEAEYTYSKLPPMISVHTKAKYGSVKLYIYKEINGKRELIDSLSSDAGTYFIKAALKDDINYSDAESEFVSVKILKAKNKWKTALSIKDWTIGNHESEPTASAEFGNVYYKYSDHADGLYTSAKPKTEGRWFVKAYIDDNENYSGLESEPVSFTVNKQAMTVVEPDKPKDSITKDDKDVQTSDTTNLGLWASLLIAATGLAAILTNKRRKENK